MKPINEIQIDETTAKAILAEMEQTWCAKFTIGALIKPGGVIHFDTILTDGTVETEGLNLVDGDYIKIGVGGECFPLEAKKFAIVCEPSALSDDDLAAADAAGIPFAKGESLNRALAHLNDKNPRHELTTSDVKYHQDAGEVSAFRIPEGVTILLEKYGKLNRAEGGKYVLTVTSTNSARVIAKDEFLGSYASKDSGSRDNALWDSLPELSIEEIESMVA